MHEVLRALAERLGPEVFDDPDNFRGVLDDVLDDDVALGDQNLVVDAVRLGAYASMATMLQQGGDPASTVAQAGARLARDRGGDDLTSATWACACLAYAVGAIGEAEVLAYRTARRRTLEPPPPAPVTAPSAVPVQSPPAPPTYVAPEADAEPGPVGGRWLVPVLVVLALVAAVTAGVLAAQRLGGDDEPSTASDTPSTTTPPTTPPTTPSPTPPTTPTTPTTEPTTPATTAPTPVTTRVENTCANGDCFLSERAGPRADAPELGTHNNGATVRVVCQVLGQEISSSKLGTSSKVWAKTANGGFVAAIFLSGIDKYAVSTPC